jgi:hypothetical protein
MAEKKKTAARRRPPTWRPPTLEDVLTPSVVTGGGFPLGGVMEDVDDAILSGARGLKGMIGGMIPQTPLDFALEFGIPMPGSAPIARQVGRQWDSILRKLDDTALGDLYDAILRRLPTSPPPDVIGSRVDSITDIGEDLPGGGISRTNRGFNPEARSIQGGPDRPTRLGVPTRTAHPESTGRPGEYFIDWRRRDDVYAKPRYGPRVPRDQQGWERRPNPSHIDQLAQDTARARRRGLDPVTERLRRRQEDATPGAGPLDRRRADQPGALPMHLGRVIPESVGALNPDAPWRMPGFRNRQFPSRNRQFRRWSDSDWWRRGSN